MACKIQENKYSAISKAIMLAAGLCISAISISGCASNNSKMASDGCTPTAREFTAVKPQENWKDSIIYFVLLDRFADGDKSNNKKLERHSPGGYHGGDLKGLIQQIDEIADLGATAIWINPVVKQSEYYPPYPGKPGKWREFNHTAFHGYWVEDFNKIDPHFGTEDDLKTLVEEAHKRGIKVLLDVVYNHPGYDGQETFPKEWLRQYPHDCDDVDPVHCSLAGLPDFKTELPEVRDHMLDAYIGLAKRTGLDGFRLDTIKHVDSEFWQVHRERTRKEISDDFFLIGELWGGEYRGLNKNWFKPDYMDAGLEFQFKGECLGFAEGKARPIAFGRFLEKRERIEEGHFLGQFLSSHDERMFIDVVKKDMDKIRMCVAMQFVSNGIPIIYYGEEVAREGEDWPLNRSDMPWADKDILPGVGERRDEALRKFYKTMIETRRAHPALWRGTVKTLNARDAKHLFLEKKDPKSDDLVWVFANPSDDEIDLVLDIPPEFQNKNVINVITGDKVYINQDGKFQFSIPEVTTLVLVADGQSQDK